MSESNPDSKAARGSSGRAPSRGQPAAEENSFFAELGLSQGRGGQGGAPASGKAEKLGTPKNPLAAPAGARKQPVKKSSGWRPAPWQIITAVGAVLVVVILAIAALSGGGSEPDAHGAPAPTVAQTESRPQSPIEFGPHTVKGPVDDRTVLSPVAGVSVQVPFERHGDLMLADVKINDQDAGKFLLDTGTRDLIISGEVADKLHLPARRSRELKMPGRMQTVTERKVNSLAMGALRLEEKMILPPPRNDEWLAIAVDIKPWADAIHLPIAGVIGGDVWSQVPFSIDPASRQMTFFQRGPFPFSAGLQPEFLTRFDNFLKPAITANLDHGPDGTFLLATGSPAELMVRGSSKPVATFTAFGGDISHPKTVESKDGDGYFDANNDRQSGVIGAGILSHYLLMFDYAGEKFLALPIKK